MSKSKKRIIKDYESLSDEMIEQIKIVYPDGFSEHLIEFKNKDGDIVSALPFETMDTIFLIRMSKRKAYRLVEEDKDYDDSGNLIDDVRDQYEEKHSDVDYLSENENYSEDS